MSGGKVELLRKIASIIMVTLLVVSFLSLSLKIPSVERATASNSYYVTAEARIIGPNVDLSLIFSKIGGTQGSNYVQWGTNPFYRVYVDNTFLQVYSGDLESVMDKFCWGLGMENTAKDTFTNLVNIGALDSSSVMGNLSYNGNIPGVMVVVVDNAAQIITVTNGWIAAYVHDANPPSAHMYLNGSAIAGGYDAFNSAGGPPGTYVCTYSATWPISWASVLYLQDLQQISITAPHDGVVIYNIGALTLGSLSPAPIGYLRFDEGSGNVAYDSSGNGNDGTIYGATWCEGKTNGGLSFDGVDDYVSVSASPSLNPLHSGTFECWFKLARSVTAGDGQAFYVISVPGAGGAYSGDWCVAIDSRVTLDSNAGKLYAGIYDSSSWPYDNGWHFVRSNQTGWAQDTWYHIAWTFGSDGQTLYINGIRDSSDNFTGEASFNGYSNVWIGKDKQGTYNYFNGAIDEMRIYNYARTADEIWSDCNGINGLSACVHLTATPSSILEELGRSSNLVATVSDQLGNPMPGVNVTFATTLGSLSATSTFTDSQGMATVALSPDSSTISLCTASISAVAEGASASIDVTLYPSSSPPTTSWKTCNAFQIQSASFNFAQYLEPFAEAYNWLYVLNPEAQINITNLKSLPPVSFYTITKSSSASQTDFSQALSNFFSINADSGYDPQFVFILEVPILQTFNVLLNANFTGPITIPLPDILLGLLDNSYLQTTTTGYFNFAFASSKCINTDKAAGDALLTLANVLESLIKSESVSVSSIVDALNEAIEAFGDLSLSIVTSDLNQIGPLQSYVLMDLLHVADAISTISGLTSKVFDLSISVVGFGLTAGLSLPSTLAGAVVRGVDIGLELVAYVPGASSLTHDPLYETLETGVGMIDTLVDPNGTTVLPSFYDSNGSLLLGYNSTSGDITYASSQGMLIPIDGDWLAFLGGNSSSPTSYSAGLNSFGGNASVPYNLQVISSNPNATVLGYSGMVVGGNITTIPVTLDSNGSLEQQVYLNSEVSVNESSDVFDFVATGLLSNGSNVYVDDAYLMINSSQYEMTRLNDSAFELSTGLNSSGLTQYSVYLLASNMPGGYATGYLRDELAVCNATQTKTVVGRGYNVTISDALQNQGDFDETFNVTYSLGSNAIYQPQVNLTSGISTNNTFKWNSTGFAYGNYTANVSVQPVLGEINTTNNNATSGTLVVTIPGDINGNYKVDLSDLVLLANAYGTNPNYVPRGYHQWNPNADIDSNGVVGLSDLVILATHYGKHYP